MRQELHILPGEDIKSNGSIAEGDKNSSDSKKKIESTEKGDNLGSVTVTISTGKVTNGLSSDAAVVTAVANVASTPTSRHAQRHLGARLAQRAMNLDDLQHVEARVHEKKRADQRPGAPTHERERREYRCCNSDAPHRLRATQSPPPPM